MRYISNFLYKRTDTWEIFEILSTIHCTLPINNFDFIHFVQAIAPLETKLPLENTVSEILEASTSEYLVPVGVVIEELSIKSPEELSLPPEKSNDAEKLPEVVEVDSYQKSIDNKEDENDRWVRFSRFNIFIVSIISAV